MNELIKEIRRLSGYTQEKMAEYMGTSPITVSRWENDKVIPNNMAQIKLYDLCQKKELDLSDFLIENNKSDEKDVLYHASRKGIKGSIQPISRDKCDFGKGFYMGDNILQPLTLVCNEKDPVFYTLKFFAYDFNIIDIKVDLDWAMLIAYYRGYMDEYKDTRIYKKYAHFTDGYDAIIGYIADDRIYAVMTDFFEGRITDEALIACLSALKLGRQCVCLDQKACDRLVILKEKKLSRLELLLLGDISEKRRKEGISLTRKYLNEYRRVGYYFDEIIEGKNHG
ncbi:MAG: DUF3990 domain-containing protein [Erysipelotrichaceae bacterium]|nr:DUF3990 domain-containing protein [Erysipelotrichaceae bacterium]